MIQPLCTNCTPPTHLPGWGSDTPFNDLHVAKRFGDSYPDIRVLVNGSEDRVVEAVGGDPRTAWAEVEIEYEGSGIPCGQGDDVHLYTEIRRGEISVKREPNN